MGNIANKKMASLWIMEVSSVCLGRWKGVCVRAHVSGTVCPGHMFSVYFMKTLEMMSHLKVKYKHDIILI